LKPLLEGGGYKLRIEDALFVPRQMGASWDIPWAYVRSDPRTRCDIYHRVFFDVLKHIHSYCRECYKVVVRPRTLVELFDLYEMQCEMDVACKCGIEVRDTTAGLYGGYFYCRGVEEGRERYKQVRKLVSKHLSPKTGVTLKRYCTEYEIGPGSQGPSDKIGDVTPAERKMEEYVEQHFPRTGFASPQAFHILAATMLKWIKWAYQNGDETYLKFNDGLPIIKKTVTYHEEKKGGK
jgi:hypothetical protein